jgi:predicted TIM-barrel fold metal-dependent hydrolase
MVGVKLYPVLAHFDGRDRRHDPFYEALLEHRLPVLWHIGATPSSPGRLAHSHPLVIGEVATRHPELRQIIAHIGHPWQRDAVQVLRTNRNVYADVFGIWARPLDGLLALLNAQEWGVIDHLFAGSDYPYGDPRRSSTACITSGRCASAKASRRSLPRPSRRSSTATRLPHLGSSDLGPGRRPRRDRSPARGAPRDRMGR